jgi:hypothetical protein
MTTTAFGGFYWTAAQSFFPRTNYGGYTNLGVPGEGINGMEANFSSNVVPIINAAHSAGEAAICSMLGGTNDIAVNGSTGAQTWTFATEYWNQAVAAGSNWNIAYTIMPRGTIPFDGNETRFETQRQLYNAQLLANGASVGVNFIADLGNDPSMGNPANLTNPQLWQSDQTHPAYVGELIVTSYYAAGVMSYNSTATVTSITPNSGPMEGGTAFTIKGTKFLSAPGIVAIVGGIQANEVRVIDDNTLEGVTGVAYGTGVGPIFVLTGDGAGVLLNGWTWTT